MADQAVKGQLDLFNIESFNTQTVASNFDMGLSLSNVSTRTKVSPHKRPITTETIERMIITLTSLTSLK